MKKINTYRLKLKIYKAFAKHPRLSYWSLILGEIAYVYTLWALATWNHGFFSFEFWAGLVLAYTAEHFLSSRVKKLFGR